MAKKTAWFPGDVKPARPGVYERRFPGCPTWFSRWDGERWRSNRDRIEQAAAARHPSAFQTWQWRGLAAPAQEAKP